ncbi:MAG TPA: tetratricopeptide repeat protein, partial [Candidatus Babeliales bacterium]|nr:tetratricopeptide repeat protein [Candidatus Babeliales bacterium]
MRFIKILIFFTCSFLCQINSMQQELSEPKITKITCKNEWLLSRLQIEKHITDAKKGDPKAQNHLGFLLQMGLGVEKNLIKAVECFRKAAEQSNAMAQYNLGLCYLNGDGIEKNSAKAAQWFEAAAQKNYTNAQIKFGCCCLEGIGTTKNENEAVKWFTKAAEKNDDLAQFYLGNCYEQGIGVEKNIATAIEWYTKAAEKNDKAQLRLGLHYLIAKNDTEAVKWLEKAADQKNSEAQSMLGDCYFGGIGVEKSLIKAIELYAEAAEAAIENKEENDDDVQGHLVEYKNQIAKAVKVLIKKKNTNAIISDDNNTPLHIA